MDFTKFDEHLDLMVSEGVPGIDCVVMRDHGIIHRHRAGFADMETKRPITGDEKYLMWSVSKVATCTAAVKLVEDGVISLDDPVSKYIEEYGDLKKVVRGEDGTETPAPVENELKIVHLFTMTSGFSYNIDTPAIKEFRQASNGRCPTVGLARAIARSPLEFEPGTSWMYGLSHDILAAVAEVASGVRFADLVKELIFDPLGMKNSTFRKPDKKDNCQMAVQYSRDWESKRISRTDNSNFFALGPDHDSGGAGLVSTAEDCALLADALACGGVGASGKRILKEETVRLMATNRLTTEQRYCKRFREFHHLKGYGYGLGVRVMLDVSESGGVGAVGEFGWDGAAGSVLLADPERKISMFYAQHLLNDDNHLEELRDALYRSL